MEMEVEGPLGVGDYLEKDNTVQEILEKSEVEADFTDRLEIIPRHLTESSPTFSILTDSLILCAASTVTPSLLHVLNVTCLINVAPELPDPPLSQNDLIHLKVPVVDTSSSRIDVYFNEVVDMIQQVADSGGKTLVYCVAGVSRSATMCLAHLMKHHGMFLLDAYNYVKRKRPKIRPNCAFFRQLIEYEKEIFDCNTVTMIYNDLVRMEIPDVYDCDYRLVTRPNSDKSRSKNGRY